MTDDALREKAYAEVRAALLQLDREEGLALLDKISEEVARQREPGEVDFPLLFMPPCEESRVFEGDANCDEGLGW